MYQMRCTRPEVEAKCKRLSCVHPTICKLLGTDHGPLVELMQQSRAASRASARCSSPAASAWTWPSCRPSTCDELAAHHVGGHLKVAPEHTDPDVLDADEEAGRSTTSRASPRRSRRRREQAGKPKQYLVPYFIASHPGSDLHAMIDLAAVPEAQRLPARPGAGLHPRAVRHRHVHVLHGHRPVHEARRSTSPRHLRDRKMQRALMQFFKPENYFEVREALIEAGRQDLIGSAATA